MTIIGIRAQLKLKKSTSKWFKTPKTSFNLYKQGKIVQASIGDPDLFKANKNNKDVVSLDEATTSYIQYNQSGKK